MSKPKRGVKAAPRKKQKQTRSLGPQAETVVVDVIEQAAPGVITITEFEETQLLRRGWMETNGNREP
jgi:hypothetical protein